MSFQNIPLPLDMQNRLHAIEGKTCWHVSAGNIDFTFNLYFGERVTRDKPLLRNQSITKTQRGEYELLVWCPWRLGTIGKPLSGSDEKKERIATALRVLEGLKVTQIQCVGPAWDLQIDFDDRIRLWVFAEYLPGDPSIDTNWELWHHDTALLVGPGYEWKLHP